jgi:hypothetical protein
LFYIFKLNRGLTVVKTGGVYSTGRWYTQDELDSFDEYYLGGHEYTGISEVTKAALIAGGIDVTEANFVAE